MAAEVIPAILEKTLGGIKKKVAIAQPYCSLLHLDVMDGEFVLNKTYNSSASLAELPVQWEIHLMIKRPELFVKKWCLSNVRRIIVHLEATQNLNEIIRLTKEENKEIGLAINPESEIYQLEKYLDKLDSVLIMGVMPGAAGQKFNKEALNKIRRLKNINKKVKIEVDGGVDAETHQAIVQAGADILVSGSFLFDNNNFKERYEELKGA